MKGTIRSQFDEILGRHLERLIGTKQGIGGLPLNIATIVCFVLLGGREIEIENSPSAAIERYTHDTFLHEAADMGIDPDEYLKTGLQDMIQRGYVELVSDGRFRSRQSTITMVRVLDSIFPKMPGINFLAYIGQTIEEAISGRTDMAAATSRFDQTLKHHGVPVFRHKSSDASPFMDTQTSHATNNIQQKKQISREQILTELYSRAKTSEQPDASPSFRTNHKILTGGTVLKFAKVDEILLKEKKALVEAPRVAEHSRAHNLNVQNGHEKIQEKNTAEEPDVDKGDEYASLTKQGVQSFSPDVASDHDEATLIPAKKEDTQLIDAEGEEESTHDDDIAHKIAAFEKDLALTCPICRVNMLKEQSTSTGKIFYSCPSRDCNFISWGKPHLVECKRCKNPFLVEATDTSGQIILKCPRATCQHRQSLSPRKVMVVRKRLVRRRK